MFASHADRSHSSFDSPSAKEVAGRVLGHFGRNAEAPRAELLPKGLAAKKFGGSRDAVTPVSQNISVRSRRAFSGRSMVTENELHSQEWLDNRLATFYHERQGLWPRVRRFLSGDGHSR